MTQESHDNSLIVRKNLLVQDLKNTVIEKKLLTDKTKQP